MTSDLERNEEEIREWRSEKCNSSIQNFFICPKMLVKKEKFKVEVNKKDWINANDS